MNNPNVAENTRPHLWKKGQSGNPGGRAKGVEALARAHTAEAIAALVKGLEDPKHYAFCAEALLNRGWGRPKQMIAGDADNPVQFVIRGPLPVKSTQEWLERIPRVIEAGVTSE